jgi:transmembrane sensor
MNSQINQEAAAWFVEFHASELEPDARICRAFDAWLRKSPDHVRAFLDMFPIWDDSQHVHRGPNSSLTAPELITLARNAVPITLLVTKARIPADRSKHSAPSQRSRWFSAVVRWAVAACLVLAFGIAGTWAYTQRGTYTTDTAEQRTITLADGTAIALNARSKVRVRYLEHARNIELVQGEALFKVARDSKRPFLVRAGTADVKAIGTEFDINRRATGTTITVIEGTVAVNRAPRSANKLLTAGEQLRVPTSESSGQAEDIQRPVTPQRVDTAAATSWTQNRLTFSNTSLLDVAEEFNRHNTRQLSIGGNSLAAIKVSGVFSATDITSFLRFLRAQPGIVIRETEQQIYISQPREGF